MHEQTDAALLRHRVAAREKEQVDIIPGDTVSGKVIEGFDPIPECIGMKHEAGPGHNIGPVACFILLQEIPALVLLALQPANCLRQLRRQLSGKLISRNSSIKKIDGNEPPEGGIDTT